MMTLSTTVWENGRTIEVRRLNPGLDGSTSSDRHVQVTVDDRPAVVFDCADREACYEASRRVMGEVWGRDHVRGGINATNSMVWDFTNLIEQIAGC